MSKSRYRRLLNRINNDDPHYPGDKTLGTLGILRYFNIGMIFNRGVRYFEGGKYRTGDIIIRLEIEPR